MNNLFDSTNYPVTEPVELVIGSRWVWKRPDITSVYDTATYSLVYRISAQSTSKEITVTASKISGEHVVEVASTASTSYRAGDYRWKAVIVRDSDSEEIVLDEGFVVIKSKTGDVSSHVYKTLMAIRATIENKATKDQMSYSINGRSLQRYTFSELTKLEAKYSKLYRKEQNDINRKNGRAGKNRVLTKLGA